MEIQTVQVGFLKVPRAGQFVLSKPDEAKEKQDATLKKSGDWLRAGRRT